MQGEIARYSDKINKIEGFIEALESTATASNSAGVRRRERAKMKQAIEEANKLTKEIYATFKVRPRFILRCFNVHV